MLAIINTYIDDPDDKSYMIWLYEEFHRLMFSTARKYTSNQTDCEDIVQNALVGLTLSELSEEQERQMYVLDEYPSEQTHFHVRGYDVAIENEDLANALTVLPDDKRDIVLLAYFLDMTDQEIADKLDMVRRTVQYKRAQSLKELKKEMEVTEDGAQSE